MDTLVDKDLSPEGVLTLRMNRPDVLNSLNYHLVFALIDAFNEASVDDKTRVVILTGKGRSFCAGADLNGGDWPQQKGKSAGQAVAHNMEIGFNVMHRAIVNCEKPVICAINGIAAGGGVGVALSGDLVIAGESAGFKLVFAPQLGIIPDVGASWHVPQLIGRARANGMALLGETLPATQAAEWGLVWETVPDDKLMAHTKEIAIRMADGAISGMKAASRAHSKALLQTLDAQLDYERDMQEHYCDQPVFYEGVRAFMEKRKPNFRQVETEQIKTAREQK